MVDEVRLTKDEKLAIANQYFDDQLAIMAKYGTPAQVSDTRRTAIVNTLAKLINH